MLLLAACQLYHVTQTPQKSEAAPIYGTPTLIPPTLDVNTPTLVVTQSQTTANISIKSITQDPTPVSDPLRFAFPAPGPPPVSAWRPPLYTTPWAPTPYDHFYFARPIPANEINWP